MLPEDGSVDFLSFDMKYEYWQEDGGGQCSSSNTVPVLLDNNVVPV
jgi:hypothetical protein